LGLELDGSVQSFEIPVANQGDSQPLIITGISFTGPASTGFSTLSSPAGIGPGQDGIIQISFNPAGLAGNIFADLAVQSDDPALPVATVALHGFLHDPRLVAAQALDFGILAPGAAPRPASLAVSNSGGGQTLTISGVTISGADADHFSVTGIPDHLTPLTAGSIELSFDPMNEEGPFGARLTINSNDAADATTVVNLSARVGALIPNSGVRLNEFMASNGQTLDDGDGDSSDWIEIHNAGPGAADLSGWFLTDDADNPEKWEFPPGTSIPENGYLIVFAS
ncbi:MAG: choice-of-anchor D domain-containing protein, partial [Akkermansiaceae bacterium]|nr:choice-of-anchor D domain-containing protein [Akkermansiaceae bacterium]